MKEEEKQPRIVAIRGDSLDKKSRNKRGRSTKREYEWKARYYHAFTGKKRSKYTEPKNRLLGIPTHGSTDWRPTLGELLPVLSVRWKESQRTPDRLRAPWGGSRYPHEVRPVSEVVTSSFIPDESGVVAALRTGSVVVWKKGKPDPMHVIKVTSELSHLQPRKRGVHFVWLDDGRVAFNLETTYIVIDVETAEVTKAYLGKFVAPHPKGARHIEGLEYASYGDLLALSPDGARGYMVRHYDTTPPAPVSGRVGGAPHPPQVHWSRLQVLDLTARTVLTTFDTTENCCIEQVVISPDGKWIAISTVNGSVHVLSRATLDGRTAALD